MLGSQTDNHATIPALVAKDDEMVCNKMQVKVSASPSPMLVPIPPLRFCTEIEAPINISNVAMVCKKCGPTKIGYKIDGDKKIRVCRKCGEAL